MFGKIRIIEPARDILLTVEDWLEKRQKEKFDAFLKDSLANLLENGKMQVNIRHSDGLPATLEMKLPRFVVDALDFKKSNGIRLNDRLNVLTSSTGYTASVKDRSLLRKSIVLTRK